MPVRKSFLTWAICLLGLATTAACYLPPDDGTSAPGLPDPHVRAEPWTPSEEWTRLNDWDREIRAMDPEGDEWDLWRAERAEFEQYLIDNPDADAPCDVWYRYAPQELHYRGDECVLAAS